MSRRPLIIGALLCLSMLQAGAPALAADTYRIDPVHSNVEFRIRHLVSYVSGRFTSFKGTVVFDEKLIEGSSVDVMIEATSVTTDNEKRDADLRSDNFFDVETYPLITFKSSQVRRVDATHFTVVGDLTMRGVKKSVALDAEYLGLSAGMGQAARIGFSATTKIDRKDYGFTWNRNLDTGGVLLGDDVTIQLFLEGIAAGEQQ